MNYKQFTIPCAQCQQLTSKSYARANGGKCKVCVTGIERKPSSNMLCPDCGEHYLTPYQKAHRYHCDHCTREADPVGHYNEVMGINQSCGEY